MPTDPTAHMTPKAREAYAKAQQMISECKASGDTVLDLVGLGLTALPPEIGQLTKVTVLYLSNNRLSTLSPEIGQLTALTVLSLENNQLSTLPPEIGKLLKLKFLLLGHNALKELPEELRQLKLTNLQLGGNELLGLPTEMVGVDDPEATWVHMFPDDILRFYFSRLTQGDAPMQEVRVLLIGRGRVGKTSLIKALQNTNPDPKEPETPGITVSQLPLTCPQGEAKAHMWDFGGQEFLHGTHQIFLSERCVYVLVLEGREGNWEAETDYWLRFIQSFGGNSPVIVVLNKYAEHPFSVDTFRLRERCPQIVGFVNTDAVTRMGVENLCDLLTQTVDGMKEVWLTVPRNWHRVKEALEQMPDRYLGYPAYQALCARHEVVEAQEQDSLASTLHQLGIALNFRDHARLKHTSVLKPEWVTDGIYGLLRYTQAKDCHGVFQRDWMSDALPAEHYPAEKHDFVLELMAKFEVAFPLDGDERWLIPELLRETQPEAFAEFTGDGVQRLRFIYPDALPPGLLPRFIVRTHEMSDGHPNWRWRSGVVLEWEACRALVRLNRSERRTEIAVINCPRDDQQNLFDLIRAHLTILHGKVRVIEEVELPEHPDTWVKATKLRLLETKNIAETQEETKEGDLTTVPVKATLDPVESQESRDSTNSDSPAPLRLFVSYAHADERKIRALSRHLTVLGSRGYIQTWQDTQLIAGEQWMERILEELAKADTVLLLYSENSQASKFIQETEAPEAVRRAKEGRTRLIVVPLDTKDWDKSHPLEKDLSTFQTATWNAKPVLHHKPHGEGWTAVREAILKVVRDMRGKLDGERRKMGRV